MDPKSLSILEFPKVLDALVSLTSFSAGSELAERLRPLTHPPLVARRQSETTQARALLDEKPDVSLDGARDIRPHVGRAEKGISLTATELLDVQSTVTCARSLRRTLIRLEDRFPLLARNAERLDESPGLISEISRCIDDHGRIRDGASSTLNRLRREVEASHKALLDKMDRIINSKENAPYLQEPIVTQRAGRYVILLKADHKGKIPGIVHDQSASGMTLFVEPMATVDLANRWRQLEMDLKREEERILSALSAQVAENASALRRTVRALGELDLALAKARYSQEIRGIEAQLIPDSPDEPKGFHLLGARHPLLKGDVVPIDIVLGEGFTVLVITGPNTGGKTVTLKTVGVLTLMAQAGLHIPAAEGSRLSVFRGVYADIGDEQSIEQSLSTFSSHMTNIINILKQADSSSLVLLDELGAGTDPTEGSALGQAILSHLLERCISTVATTHYPELKAYAHLTPGVENASVEFDAETLAPTYKVRMGLPGRSNALAIAQHLGLPQLIIEGARQASSQSRVIMENLLADIKVSREEALAAEAEAKLTLERTLKEQEELKAQRLDREAAHREMLEEERRRVRAQLQEIRERLRRLERDLQMGTPLLQDVREAKEELEELASQVDPLPAVSPSIPGNEKPGQFQPGDWVSVDELGQEGEIIALSGGEAEVRIGNFRVRVDASKMRLNRPAERPPDERTVSITAAVKPLPHTELDLRGLRAEDALARLDKHLDEAYLAGLPWVRIIHGKGTGVLRQGVRELLEDHPLVSSHRPGDRTEGGDGVTIATLVGSA